MKTIRQLVSVATTVALVSAAGACAGGGIGDILGGVLGGGQQQSGQLTGIIRSVDQNSAQISIQQSNGQTVWVSYDNQTQVVYQNRNYPVNALEYGDEVTARVQASGNRYYTDYVQVNRSVSGSGSGVGGAQAFEATVRQIDRNNGLMLVDLRNGARVTVAMPYRPSSATVNRFNSLRQGDYIRFYGTVRSNTRIDLDTFY